MRVDTATFGLAALNAVTGGVASGVGSSAAGTSFGPAALLSISGAVAPSALDGLYSAIGRSLSGRATISAPKNSAKQKEIAKQIKDALDASDHGRISDARKQMADLARANPGDAATAQAQGAVEIAAGDYKSAEKFFRKADVLDPSLNAQQDLQTALALQKDDKTALAQADRWLNDEDTRASGKALLELLAKRSPRNADIRIKLGDVALAGKDELNGLLNYARAMGVADQAQLGRLEDKFRTLLSRTKQGAFVENLLGKTQLKLGKLDEALATLHDATVKSEGRPEYQSDEAVALVAIGRDQLSRGNVASAMSNFDEAYHLDPSSDDVHLARAEGLTARARGREQAGDYNRAIDDFESAAREANRKGGEALRKQIASGVYDVGRRLQSRRERNGDDIGKEVAAYQAAYDIDPSNTTYRDRLAASRVALGDQYAADGDDKNAAASYKRAVDLVPRNDGYRTKAIEAYNRYGADAIHNLRFDDAITAYRNAYDLDKHSEATKSTLAGVYDQAGVYYRDQGDRGRAEKYFAEAVHLYPNNADYRAHLEDVS